MTIFEYVMVLISVVLSLGLAQLLSCIAYLLKSGRKVKASPTLMAWWAVIFASHLDLWASLWTLHQSTSWGLPGLIMVLAAAGLLYLAAAFATPDPDDGEVIDLWAFHMANRRRYALAMVVYILIGIGMNSLMLTRAFDAASLFAATPGLLFLLAAVLFRQRLVQILAPLAVLAIMAAYFAFYFPTLT